MPLMPRGSDMCQYPNCPAPAWEGKEKDPTHRVETTLGWMHFACAKKWRDALFKAALAS